VPDDVIQNLTRLGADGTLDRIARGRYRLCGADAPEYHSFAFAATVAPKGVICLLRALSYCSAVTDVTRDEGRKLTAAGRGSNVTVMVGRGWGIARKFSRGSAPGESALCPGRGRPFRPAVLAAALVGLLAGVAGPHAAEVTRLGKLPPAGDEPSYLCAPGADLATVGTKVLWPSARDLWLIDPGQRTLSVLRDFGAGPFAGDVGVPADAGGVGYMLGSDGVTSGLWTTDLTTAGTRLAAALDRTLAPSTPVGWNGKAYFVARRPAGQHRTVWRSDGTVSGTAPVPNGPEDAWLLQPTAKGVLCATRVEYLSGFELWVIDGTTAGSTVLATFPSPSLVHVAAPFGDGVLVLLTRGGSTWSWELWRSDLTPAGTKLVATLPEAVDVNAAGPWLGSAGGVGVFATLRGWGNDERRTLWRTNGTAAGTYPLVPPGDSDFAPASPAFFASAGDAVLFAGSDGAHGVELWRTDGSAAGTARVLDINPGSRSAVPQWLTASGGKVFFTATDVFAGRELWVSDATPAGTHRVTDLCPGPFASVLDHGLTSGQDSGRILASAGGLVVFAASSGMGGCGFWVSDGSESGTHLAVPMGGVARAPGSVAAAAGTPETPRLLAVNGSALAQLRRPWGWSEVWRSDGAAGSFEEVASPSLARLFDPAYRAGLHGVTYFSDAVAVVRTDGTAAGSVPAFPGPMTRPSAGEAGVFYFWRTGPELWRSDGNPAGTRRVKRFTSGATTPAAIAQIGDAAYFVADDGVSGLEPWRSDGTEAGTVLLADTCPGTCSPEPSVLAVSGGRVFFSIISPAGVLAADGTTASTRAVHWGSFREAVAFAGGLLLYDREGDLYFTDGTTSVPRHLGHFMAARLAPITAADGELHSPLLFQAQDDAHGVELWRTDGTAAGTSLVRDISPGPESSAPYFLTQAYGRTWFCASDPAHGAELWSSDGTEAGTRLEADVEPGPRASVPLGLVAAGNRLVFQSALWPDELWSARISPLPRLDAWSSWAAAGTGGDGSARVAVSLTEPAGTEVSVGFATEDDSARAGSDYLPVGGRLTFAPGTAGPLEAIVPLVASAQPKPIRQLFVRLFSPAGAVIGRGTATVTLSDERMGRSEPRRRLRSSGGQP
jgi:ELWxxDGT repeat protein